jgi:mono/diheme cytochrome c family protein
MKVGMTTAVLVLVAGAVLGPGSGSPALAQSAPTADFKWQMLGNKTYDTYCGGCHQRSGQGLEGGFPPLAGHAPQILARPGGRAYMARLVLFGLTGAIEVDGKPFNGVMPAWSSLSDDEVAAVIDHALTAWGNDAALPKDFTPIVPSEIAAARAENLTPERVYALREPGGTRPSDVAQAGPSFTQEQADRGQAAYSHSCLDCHGSTLDNGEFGGPPLKGSQFAKHWSSGSVAGLFSFMKAKMPPDRPGKLNDDVYADLTAYILGENGYPPGDQELAPDANAQQAMSLKKR